MGKLLRVSERRLAVVDPLPFQSILLQFTLEFSYSSISIASIQNEKALTGGVDASRQSYFREADKYCKATLGRMSNGNSCMKTLAFAVVVLAVGAVAMSPTLDAWDWNKLSVLLNTQTSF